MGTILIVDDEPVTQLMLRLMLQRANHTILVASDGEEALLQLKEKPVDLVIADVNMPQMDGITLLERLRQDKRYDYLPIILFTAVSKSKVYLEAKQKGAAGLLTKPIRSDKLVATVTHHLSLSPA